MDGWKQSSPRVKLPFFATVRDALLERDSELVTPEDNICCRRMAERTTPYPSCLREHRTSFYFGRFTRESCGLHGSAEELERPGKPPSCSDDQMLFSSRGSEERGDI